MIQLPWFDMCSQKQVSVQKSLPMVLHNAYYLTSALKSNLIRFEAVASTVYLNIGIT